MIKSRRAEHAEDTREALLEVARELFAERGYVDTGIDDIAQGARVTRGALYHHFDSKRDVFRAVVERLYAELVDRLTQLHIDEQLPRSKRRGPDLWDLVCAGYQARLDIACSDRAFQRIVDQDASGVLGHATLTEIAQGSANVALGPVLEEAISSGLIAPVRVETLTNLLGAVIGAGSREVAAAEDKERARVHVGEALDALLRGLRVAVGTSTGKLG
jgi:AcrR family transcriptional regulator